MKKLFVVAFALLVAGKFAFAQDPPEKKEMKKTDHRMVGYLVDEMCGSKMAMSDVKKSDAKAARHTKDCALADHCKESGYGLVSHGKFYKFDTEGDKKAESFLGSEKKENNIKVAVVGTVEGDKMTVESIKDFTAGKKSGK